MAAEARDTSKEVPGVLFQEIRVSPSLADAVPPGWAVEVVGPDGMIVLAVLRYCIFHLYNSIRTSNIKPVLFIK